MIFFDFYPRVPYNMVRSVDQPCKYRPKHIYSFQTYDNHALNNLTLKQTVAAQSINDILSDLWRRLATESWNSLRWRAAH